MNRRKSSLAAALRREAIFAVCLQILGPSRFLKSLFQPEPFPKHLTDQRATPGKGLLDFSTILRKIWLWEYDGDPEFRVRRKGNHRH